MSLFQSTRISFVVVCASRARTLSWHAKLTTNTWKKMLARWVNKAESFSIHELKLKTEPHHDRHQMKPNKALFLELIDTNETSTHDFTNVLLPWETLFHANISIALTWSSLSSLRSLFCFSYFSGHGWWMAN